MTGRARKGAASVVVVALFVGGCASATFSPSPGAISAPVTAALSSTGTPAPSRSASPSNGASGADGTIVFYRTDDSRSTNTPFSIDPDGSHESQLALDPPSGIWSPDGSRLLVSQPVLDRSPKAGAETAWVRSALVNPDGSGLTLLDAYPLPGPRMRPGSSSHQVVPTATGAISVQWSPDGKLLAFTSESGTDDQIAVIRPDGTGLTQLTDRADASNSVAPVWSPDGTKLLFQRKRSGQVTLWTMNADGTGQTQLTPTPVAAYWVGGYAWDPAR